MAPSARASLMLAVVLACALLAATRHADAAPGGPVCNPLQDKTCKPGDPKAPENIPGHGKMDRDGDEDDELPSFSTHKTILGHWEEALML